MTRRILSVVTILLGAGCGDTTSNEVTQLNLDRPIDIAFACVGGLRLTNGAAATVDQPVTDTAASTASCDIRSEDYDPTPIVDPVDHTTHPREAQHVPLGQEASCSQAKVFGCHPELDGGVPLPPQLWYAFILQQGPGTVAVANMNPEQEVDLAQTSAQVRDTDDLTPGKNSISVGEDPIAIATDKSGCHEIIANAGSCDLSDLDVNSAIIDKKPIIKRYQVKNGAGVPITAKPAAMISEPADKLIGKLCPTDTAGAPIANGLVYIAYPGCHAVAAVDTATGIVQKAIQFDALGVPAIVDGLSLTCPDECGSETAAAGTRPVTMDLLEDPRVGGRRMAIGADNSSAIALVELDPDTTLPLSVSQVAFENTTGDLGLTQVALSPQIGMGGTQGTFFDEGAPGGQSQYVYAVATDHTVRVADILSLRKECDTQVDPRFLRGVASVKTLSCMPPGDPATPPRRPNVRGPGIELPGDAVPLSVAIARQKKSAIDVTSQSQMVGYYAVITATNGGSFVINIDDDSHSDTFSSGAPLTTAIPFDIAHQLRDAIEDRGRTNFTPGDPTATPPVKDARTCKDFNPNDGRDPLGGPRITNNPVRTASGSQIAADKVTELPNIRQVTCQSIGDAPDVTTNNGLLAVSELSYSAPTDVRDLAYPDIRALDRDEVWNLTYEGSLSNSGQESDADGPQVRESQMRVDSGGMHIVDTATKPFCSAGVEPFDILQMRGCDPSAGDAQCPKGYTCFVHPDSQIAGLGECMLVDEAERLATACKAFLTSQRRYTIKQASSGELLLLPRRVELRTTPLDGCTDDTQCKTLADYALRAPSPVQPVADVTGADPRTWTCNADPTRAPVATGKICELRCDTDSDCLTGTVCQGAGAGVKSGFCMEGVTPPQACVNGPQRYELRAGNAFAVVGTRSGFVHPIIADANGQCIKDPNANRLQIGRIPLDAPACDPTADLVTGKRADGTFDPNPCSVTIKTSDVIPLYVDAPHGDCTLVDTDGDIVERDAPAIRFRGPGMTFHIIDPFYPGDAKCILDRLGGLVRVPLAFPGYQLTFHQNAGFTPFVLPILPAFPVKVVRGPAQTLWIVDQGDFLSTNIGQASTRGKVFLVGLHSPGASITLQ
jgi:hypothetical protein